MAKKITARVGSYTNGQGEQKGRFVEIGAIGVSQAGKEYVLISPTVDLSGVLQLQNIESTKEGKESSDRIICSVFDNDNQQQSPQQQGGYQQQAGNGYAQSPNQNAGAQQTAGYASSPQPQNNQAAPSNYNNVPHAQQQRPQQAPQQGTGGFNDDPGF